MKQCLTGFTVGGSPEPLPKGGKTNKAVMDYYDGNTVTGLWNYAQHFAMSDNSYGTTYGPSTPGALNVTAAQTYGAICGPLDEQTWLANTINQLEALPTGEPASKAAALRAEPRSF